MSLILLCGFMAVNSYFILNIVYFNAKNGDINTQEEILRILYMSSWLTIVLWFLITVFVYFIKQSGIPYKSTQAEQNVRYIGQLFLMWSFAFIIKAIISYFMLKLSFSNEKVGDYTQLVLVVISNFVTEIAPIISVLEVKFIDLFKTLSQKHTRSEIDEEEGTRRLLFQTDIGREEQSVL